MAKGNPTALRTGGGSRLAGQRTVGALGRLRNRAGGLNTQIGRARVNGLRQARRAAARRVRG